MKDSCAEVWLTHPPSDPAGGTMAYQALARKWRPRNFDEVVGQEHVVKALTHALDADRTHHAYLFTGTRGVGKTTIARILAKALNCEARLGFNPCGNCSPCRSLDAGRFVDLIEVDAASRTKVEDTRDLLDNVQYAPGQGRFKIYLIDEVHMLSGHSFNALLKTLEEPPPHVKFLLATTDPQKIPVTVLSRCLQFNLKHLSLEQITQQMDRILADEGTPFEARALRAIARAAQGSMRDGLSLLDQAIVHGGGQLRESEVGAMLGTISRKPVFDLLNALADGDAAALLRHTETLAEQTPNFTDALQQMLGILHHAALAQWTPEILKRDEDAAAITELAHRLSAEDLQLFYQIALHGQRDLPLATDPQSGFEMTLLRMLAFRPADAERTAQPLPTRPVRETKSQPSPSSIANEARSTPPQTDTEPGMEQPDPQPTGAADIWPKMIDAMRLVGMSRELASHCMLRSLSDTVCELALDRGYAQLQTPQVENAIATALQAHLKRPVKLSIVTEDALQDTPAIRQRRARDERQRVAEETIEHDDNVKAFKELFGAQIVPGSIRPLD